jgi:hypothetical protein
MIMITTYLQVLLANLAMNDSIMINDMEMFHHKLRAV